MECLCASLKEVLLQSYHDNDKSFSLKDQKLFFYDII